MIRRTVIVVALVVAAASCTWPMAGQGPDRRNWAGTERAITPAVTSRITAGWSAPAAAAQEVVGDASTQSSGPRIWSRHSTRPPGPSSARRGARPLGPRTRR